MLRGTFNLVRQFSTSRLLSNKFSVGAVVIRPPVVTEDQNSFEQAYEEQAHLMRAEKTRPFSHAALQHFGLELVTEDEFVLYAPRITEADKLNDRKSLERALPRTLHLIVKQEGSWMFPTGPLPKLEDLVGASEKVAIDYFDARPFSEKITKKTRLRFYRPHNLPSGVFLPPPESPTQKYGKTFFYHLHRVTGDVQLANKAVEDYLWVTRDELKDYFDPEYLKQVRGLAEH